MRKCTDARLQMMQVLCLSLSLSHTHTHQVLLKTPQTVCFRAFSNSATKLWNVTKPCHNQASTFLFSVPQTSIIPTVFWMTPFAPCIFSFSSSLWIFLFIFYILFKLPSAYWVLKLMEWCAMKIDIIIISDTHTHNTTIQRFHLKKKFLVGPTYICQEIHQQ